MGFGIDGHHPLAGQDGKLLAVGEGYAHLLAEIGREDPLVGERLGRCELLCQFLGRAHGAPRVAHDLLDARVDDGIDGFGGRLPVLLQELLSGHDASAHHDVVARGGQVGQPRDGGWRHDGSAFFGNLQLPALVLVVKSEVDQVAFVGLERPGWAVDHPNADSSDEVDVHQAVSLSEIAYDVAFKHRLGQSGVLPQVESLAVVWLLEEPFHLFLVEGHVAGLPFGAEGGQCVV